MMNAIRSQHGEATDTAKPVLRKVVSADDLVSMLRTALDTLGLSRIRRNDHSMAIRRFEEYLKASGDDPVNVDESLIMELEHWLVGQDEMSRAYYRKMVSSIRTLVNALPDTVRQRRLLTSRDVRRLGRFDDFCPKTQEILRRFLADGRKTRQVGGSLDLTAELLSPSVRKNAVYAAARLLRVVGIDNVQNVTSGHVERYLDSYGEDRRATAVHGLSDARPLFNWLIALGVLDGDPLKSVGRKAKTADSDYVPADQIAKLADLATLDPGSFRDVRDRMIAYALCYDYGLRVGEAVRLKLSDIHINEFVEVVLRGEIQKGQGKATRTLRNLFPETKQLVEMYLRLRLVDEKSSDALLLSADTGMPLLVSGCRNAVKRVSRELGIKTHGRRTPSPHRYRHSLGTLNVGELGMKLSPYYLMRRYRHNDIRTTMDVYVANNPLLDEAQHIAIVTANGHGNGNDRPGRQEAMPSYMTVPEADAMSRVRSLGITWRSLRKHAVDKRAAVERKGKVFYSESFLDGLCSSWMTRDEAVRLMGLKSASGFRYRVKNEAIRTLVIGRASLVRAEDAVRSLRNSNQNAK